MKIWITKYALTKGIIERNNSEIVDDNVTCHISGCHYEYYHKGEWASSLENALEQTEKMRIKKIKSLEKQIQKIRTLEFEWNIN